MRARHEAERSDRGLVILAGDGLGVVATMANRPGAAAATLPLVGILIRVGFG